MEALIQALSHHLGLGALTSPPRPLNGGYLHRMYALQTQKGLYALKALNPAIMERPEALGNFRQTLAWESALEEAQIPAVTALPFQGDKLIKYGGHYFLLFPYCPGKALHAGEVTQVQIASVAELLARIHAIPAAMPPPLLFRAEKIDWEGYAGPLEHTDPDLGRRYRESLPQLLALQQEAETLRYTPARMALCHGDMDPKNILWQGDAPWLIDLECLGPGDPAAELFDLALLWAGLEEGCFDPERFRLFLHRYRESGGLLPMEADALYTGRTAPLGWLAFNLQRVLGQSGESDALALGLQEARKTLEQIQRYGEHKSTILQTWVQEARR